MMPGKIKLETLAKELKGELQFGNLIRTIYATDASVYREMPLAVAFPIDKEDVKILIRFAKENNTSLIPRTAGTSLAGQVVGNGIVVDVSRTFTKILEVNSEEQWVRVQPGVIRDELNRFLNPHGFLFGPETSTANRAMIGGMIGNNSCGSNSVMYGSARDHLMEVEAILSNGEEVTFKNLTLGEFNQKCINGKGSLESKVYQNANEILSNEGNREEIRKEFPKSNIPRRNTGYALDLLEKLEPFTEGGEAFNFCKLIAGSEGTLAFITEAKLHVNPLPPKEKGLLCVHFNSIDDALKANLIALKYNPSACELMDHFILECTKSNLEQKQNRFFLDGEPAAILVVALERHSIEELEKEANDIEIEMKAAGYGYHFPLVTGNDIKKVWNLRKAGLGLLSNIPGDAKPVAVIEDTAVDVDDLPQFIAEFGEFLKKRDLFCVYYAHAGTGELHLRPVIDLKTDKGVELFRGIATDIAELVKKFNGSLSGEHGDGRLRGEFIKYMVGEKNFALLENIKRTWDPQNIFNPGKIVDTPPMDTFLRQMPHHPNPDVETVYDFSDTHGVLRAAEACNGSADCRKTELTGGTMCPSYMASKNEKDTTRARANILREFLTWSEKKNKFDHKEIYEVMDLCLSCKGCKSECPSSVDMAKLKGEFLQHYYDANKVPLRTWMIANYSLLNSLASIAPFVYNFIYKNRFLANIANGLNGFAKERSIPLLHKTTLRKWNKKRKTEKKDFKKTVYLFCDEFTNFNDTDIGIKGVHLLEKLGYEVKIPVHIESARTYLSKGLIREAKKIAIRNVELLKDIINSENPLIGIEPSAILTLRDEYLALVPKHQKADAINIANNTLLFDEFIAKELDSGNISKDLFTKEKKLLKVHGHCHQKALGSLTPTKKMLSLPENYEVHFIPSGCCGMAGSFGYEKEHYELSMKVGELVLFPTVRKQTEDTIIVAAGTSCRHQIKDGTGRKALHPIEVLWNSLI